eukprot:gnl/Spiro4/24192_TR12007_c0_g1_i1.p1 gnl/Spiro4/24192_TR12007_c0_g1~~gnl/Spiro4/24192_TR12007_c0_g1_i1.p1  ORF type:complete len:219 (-),score=17.63 gnl/Spiro4/24192_TR12007_c0_g1_i1:47-670(-)
MSLPRSRSPTHLINSQAYNEAAAMFGDGWPDMHCVGDKLWLGSQVAAGALVPAWDSEAARAAALQRLRSHEISHVVCCCGDEGHELWTRYRSAGVQYCCTLLNDAEASRPEFQEQFERFFLDRALPFIRDAHATGSSVLIHCNAGMHRSASVAVGYEMWRCKRRFEDVFQHVQNIRGLVMPVYYRWLIDVWEPVVVGEQPVPTKKVL